jgi:acyl-coenzyme A thioesterase 9
MDIWAINSRKFKRSEELRAAGKRLDDLPQPSSLGHLSKAPSDSLLTVLLPFGSDAELRRQFINYQGQLRVGKLLEEIDAFAGNIAYLHCDDDDEVRGLAAIRREWLRGGGLLFGCPPCRVRR